MDSSIIVYLFFLRNLFILFNFLKPFIIFLGKCAYCLFLIDFFHFHGFLIPFLIFYTINFHSNIVSGGSVLLFKSDFDVLVTVTVFVSLLHLFYMYYEREMFLVNLFHFLVHWIILNFSGLFLFTIW